MRPVKCWRAIALALIALPCIGHAQSDRYDKADTFEPGKKYNCVPTTDRKGWDCSELGNAAKVNPKSASADEGQSASVTPAAVDPPKAIDQPASGPPPRPAAPSTLPSYLTSAAANGSAAPPTPAPSTVSATAAHAGVAPMAGEPAGVPVAAPTPPSRPVAQSSQSATSEPSPAAARSSHAATAPSAPTRPTRAAAPSGGAFIDLPGDQYVIELGHAARRADLATARNAITVPRGDVYEVHLRQNGTDSWLLLWGSFADIDAARAARSELAATTTPLGFPRRIAPLQAEARRVSE